MEFPNPIRRGGIKLLLRCFGTPALLLVFIMLIYINFRMSHHDVSEGNPVAASVDETAAAFVSASNGRQIAPERGCHFRTFFKDHDEADDIPVRNKTRSEPLRPIFLSKRWRPGGIPLPPAQRLKPYTQSSRTLPGSQCVRLANIDPPVRICTHNRSLDSWVSSALQSGQLWEADSANLVRQLLCTHPELHLIDLGAHVGQYSLLAARKAAESWPSTRGWRMRSCYNVRFP